MKTFREFWQCGHDTLDINDHGFHSAGTYSQFLLQEIARNRDSMAEENFVGRAAYAGQVYPCSTFFLARSINSWS